MWSAVLIRNGSAVRTRLGNLSLPRRRTSSHPIVRLPDRQECARLNRAGLVPRSRRKAYPKLLGEA